MDSATRFFKLEDLSEGFMLAHQRVFTPMLVSNRSMIHTIMKINDTPDRWTSGATTLMNEVYLEKYKSELKDDVMAICFLAYHDVEAIRDESGSVTGSRVTNVMHIDVAGSLPDMIKKKIG